MFSSYAKFLAFAVVYGVVTAITLLILAWNGPTLEAKFSPILVNQTIYNVSRFPGDNGFDRVCWEWRFTKTKRAFTKETQFSFVSQGVAVGSSPVITLGTSDQIFVRTTVVEPHEGHEFLCAQIPNTLREASNIAIESHGRYRSAIGWWDVIQPFPTIRIPPAN